MSSVGSTTQNLVLSEFRINIRYLTFVASSCIRLTKISFLGFSDVSTGVGSR